MTSVFFGVNDRYFSYSHAIGRMTAGGPGFRNPVDLAIGANDVMYVVNRSTEFRLDGVRITICTLAETYNTEFGSYGEGDGQFIWPAAIALDKNQNVYVVDEWLARISVFTKDGQFTRRWGKAGSGLGELARPSGIAIGHDDVVYIVDSRNHRVQKFMLDGVYLGQFGSFGSGPGQLRFPWGIGLDKNGLAYVADWYNDRIQQFTPDGEYQATHGRTGKEIGEFMRPTSVAVDQEGDIYVADWKNNRVQVFTAAGRFITAFHGDAGLTGWAKEQLAANPPMVRMRNLVREFTPEQVFWLPSSVKVDNQGRIAITDSARHRVQVYQKHRTPVSV